MCLQQPELSYAQNKPSEKVPAEAMRRTPTKSPLGKDTNRWSSSFAFSKAELLKLAVCDIITAASTSPAAMIWHGWVSREQAVRDREKMLSSVCPIAHGSWGCEMQNDANSTAHSASTKSLSTCADALAFVLKIMLACKYLRIILCCEGAPHLEGRGSGYYVSLHIIFNQSRRQPPKKEERDHN